MILYFLIYFLAGIGQDMLFTLNIRFVTLKKTTPAVITSFLTVLVSMVVLYNILAKLDEQRSILAIVFYAAGIATGTFLAMKLKLEKK
ncbi:MAG: DUF5698 domain-containing protein [bacterium]|nr:DUF5698 domain-containing protein [bacterium]